MHHRSVQKKVATEKELLFGVCFYLCPSNQNTREPRRMKLSIVVVNYNVKYFLEQCLHSVFKASEHVETEVFVVDNRSVDGSVQMVREKFPQVILIDNQQNVGFAKANNQAIRQAKGEYILLLNPDTVVEDDTFEKITAFMDDHPDAGGLGVKMVDGKGKFLPESKRGLPTPAVAFYKIFGLAALFPRSKTFGQYHLTYLSNDEVHSVDVLSGAFMLLRRTTLDKVGLLDESYFMYGEDIDLSYRITKGSFRNYYFPHTRIIHYKGESTKKSSINYVLVFYKAMIIFARQHFSQKNAWLFSLLINMAIYFRAFLSILRRMLKNIMLPLLDAVVIYAGIYFIQNYWAHSVVFKEGGDYPPEFLLVALPAYIVVWLISVYMSGGYDKPINFFRIFKGLFAGTVAILVIYSLLDESMRFSRAVILLGALWGYIAMTGTRLIFRMLGFQDFKVGLTHNKRYLVVGDSDEAERVAKLLSTIEMQPAFIGLVSPQPTTDSAFTGSIAEIEDIANIYKINEIIFCAKSITSRSIIDKMTELQSLQVEFKIAPPESLSLIGSNSINTAGDLYTMEINPIGTYPNRRNKRLLDVMISLVMISALPILVFMVKRPAHFLANIVMVLFARKTWVGYCPTANDKNARLPGIKRGVLNPANALAIDNLSNETLERLNLLYARDYKVKTDLDIITKGYRKLGS
ncbi:MAG TPA: glycosyltransferase [Bacteroidales bacterium]|nr:glycosyltransferase [Bacteroidales bacterium]